ncbi:MAG: hypothetical protein Q7J78_03265, partial [Clostridiales bacterium]|nr:hypothetical protein [Clostridiales bacterium]
DKPSDNQRLKNQPIQKDRNYPKRQGVSGDAGYRRERTNAVSRAAETVNAGNLSSYQRRPVKLAMKAEETVEDIKIDITRIEKEIKMEVKEIRSMKL